MKLESLQLHDGRAAARSHEAEAQEADGTQSIWKRPRSVLPASYSTSRRDDVAKQAVHEERRVADAKSRQPADRPVHNISRLREYFRQNGAGGALQPADGRDPLRESLAEGPAAFFECPSRQELIPTRPRDLTFDLHGKCQPKECPLYDEPFIPRHWCPIVFHWKASAVCHKPLYFEQVALERYGHSHGHCLEPIVSGAHFFATIAVLPYKMGLHHPWECIYPLGYYRPGNCAPKMCYPLPLSARGALYQGAAVTGLVFLLP